MAEKRMFAKSIIDSDAFLDMPATARLLYYDLAMRADDDGFVNSPKKIMRIIGASQDDMNILITRKFIIPFDNGVVVIKHWRIHNYIRKDTYNPTNYKAEMAMLEVDENKAYKVIGNDTDTIRQLSVDDTSTQIRLDKIRLDKISEDNIYPSKNSVFDCEFEEVWKLYPKKQGKENSLKAYIKARKEGITKEVIIDGLKRYIQHIKDNNIEQRFIKHGSTWFNQRCWNDDYSIKSTTDRPEGFEIIKQENNRHGGITYHYKNGIVRVFDSYELMVEEYKE